MSEIDEFKCVDCLVEYEREDYTEYNCEECGDSICEGCVKGITRELCMSCYEELTDLGEDV